MYTFEFFLDEVIERIKKELSNAGDCVEVCTERVAKINTVLTGLLVSVKSGEDENSPKVIPTIYLEDLYENYKVLFEEAANDSSMSNEDANAYAMKTTIAKIAEMCLKSKQKVLSGGLEDMDFCRFFRENHDKIIVRLVNRNYSQAYLAECPHRDFLNDFALVYGYFDKFCSDFGFIRITNSLMERIG